MREITMTSDAVRIFAYVLDFYVSSQDKFYDDFDQLWSGIFGIKNKLIYLDSKGGDISETEMKKAYEEVDAEINSWGNRLGNWRYKRFYLNQYLNHLRQQLREVKYELAA